MVREINMSILISHILIYMTKKKCIKMEKQLRDWTTPSGVVTRSKPIHVVNIKANIFALTTWLSIRKEYVNIFLKKPLRIYGWISLACKTLTVMFRYIIQFSKVTNKAFRLLSSDNPFFILQPLAQQYTHFRFSLV